LNECPNIAGFLILLASKLFAKTTTFMRCRRDAIYCVSSSSLKEQMLKANESKEAIKIIQQKMGFKL